jgi:hypothetical protein
VSGQAQTQTTILDVPWLSVFLGVCLGLGGVALVRFRREFIGELWSMLPHGRAVSLGENYHRRMEWLALGIGITFLLSGLLLIAGALA